MIKKVLALAAFVLTVGLAVTQPPPADIPIPDCVPPYCS
jgi:hypothetical protein